MPIITAVLYLGEGHWESKHRLTEMFHTQIKGGKLREEWDKGRREGVKEGVAKGVKKGKRVEKLQIIKRMQEVGIEESLIHQITKCTKAKLAVTIGE